VWGVIALLLGVVVVEYRAKQGYDATISNLQSASDGTRDVSMDEARKLVVGASRVTGPVANAQGLETYTYSWFSLFRSRMYQLTLVTARDQKTLLTFDAPAFAEDPAFLAAREAMHANAPPHDPPPFTGTPAAPANSGETTAAEQQDQPGQPE
jgi:hypothetical protein